MVKKYIFALEGDYESNEFLQKFESKAKEDLMRINDMIHTELINKKNSITHHHKSRKWDKYKKLTNDYELVFTSTQGCPSIADYYPISRSYFKLWELLNDFAEEIKFPSKPITSVFLADAPGGFGEAFINFRQGITDNIYAMSLKATNKIIPHWKFNDTYCKNNNVSIFYGNSGTGNIYDLNNIEDLIKQTGNNACYFITADGGFDFSSDFNNQEEMSFRLIMCEIYAALKLQMEGGTFVLKIYDIHNITTMRLLYILKIFYKKMYFVKPLSSRPANSEKYVICNGFNMIDKEDIYNEITSIMKHNIVMYNTDTHLCKDIYVPILFMRDIIDYNRVYITNQIMHIIKTLMLIDMNEDNYDIIKQQVRKAVKWCHKYKVPISTGNLQKYRNYFFSSSTTAGSSTTTGLM
jgi:hypothetical protein